MWITLEAVLLKLDSISYTKLAPVLALIQINFDTVQEIRLKVGSECSFMRLYGTNFILLASSR